jgi:hypothetical protein
MTAAADQAVAATPGWLVTERENKGARGVTLALASPDGRATVDVRLLAGQSREGVLLDVAGVETTCVAVDKE